MSRTIQDANLEIWEAYATSGDHGSPEHSSIVFHCLSDRLRRARALRRDGDKADVEKEISTLPERELTALLEQATDLK